LIEYFGKPDQIRTDNGPEFTSNDFKQWCELRQIKHIRIQPGKPSQNGFIERFNRTFREDILDAYIFESIDQLNMISEQWTNQYNHEHPHQSLGGISPIAFKYSRSKIIDAYEKVKAKMNGSPFVEPALTISSPSMAHA